MSEEELKPHEATKEFWEKHGKRLAELVFISDWSVKEYGNVVYNEEWLYGRRGLTEQEFIEHLYLTSKLIGIIEVTGEDDFQWIQDRYEEHITEALNNMKQKAEAE